MSVGYKKLDDITACGLRLANKGWLTRTLYSDKNKRNDRIQYTMNDDAILAACRKCETEWYAQWKDETIADEQAAVIANPEQHTESELKEAISPEPKPVAEGYQKNPFTGRHEKAFTPPVVSTPISRSLFDMINDTRTLAEIKAEGDNHRWSEERKRASSLRYQQANRHVSIMNDDPLAPF